MHSTAEQSLRESEKSTAAAVSDAASTAADTTAGSSAPRAFAPAGGAAPAPSAPRAAVGKTGVSAFQRAFGRTSAERTRSLILCALFTTLTAVGAFIKIPVPVVPFTLQFLFTMMAGLLLGGRRGAISVGTYVVLGLIGLPIFAEGGGIWYVMKPSFGYLIGFVLATWVTGTLAERMETLTIRKLLGANFLGLAIVYGCGMIYYYVASNYLLGLPIGAWKLLLYCFILAVPGDICLCILAAFLAKRIKPALRLSR
ncbi:MAG: biotin transporter BioY [Anaerovoracaceae bacterium]|jgi:biotin transport system substrate-specific component